MTEWPVLRQVALMTSDLTGVVGELVDLLGCDEPFNDPIVGEFGLENRVLSVGGSFIEVLTPRVGDSAGARFLARRGGDAGYMAIFQVASRAASLAVVETEDLTAVWSFDLEDMSSIHLHPRHTPGALVSLDAPIPSDSWRWAGPGWSATRKAGAAGGIRSLVLGAASPGDAAAAWGRVLGQAPVAGNCVRLPAEDQRIDFIRDVERDGVLRCVVAVPGARELRMKVIGGVEFMVPPWRSTT